jgi:UDP-N-acetylmuramoyl-tripeptide--D-alanyl-D-alanine ligase
MQHTRPLWESSEIITATQGVLHGESFVATGVAIDTRRIKVGNLFLALEGNHADGHSYLHQAKQAGAAGAIVRYIPANAPVDFPLIVTHNVQEALEDLGRAARQRSEAAIIAVTGSVGKTSAKEMLKLALAPYGVVYATEGNYNNHLGLPLSLANMPRSAEFGVFEMGMNHLGEIEFLSRLGRPHVGLITNVEAVHLEFFDSEAQIAQAKAELFTGMAAGSPVVLNADNPYYTLLATAARKHELDVVTFGTNASADFQVIEANLTPTGTEVFYLARGEKRQLTLGSTGSQWAAAAVSVCAVVDALHLPLAQAEAALLAFTEPAGRGKILSLPWQGGILTVIDDSYNASPVSMRAAMINLGRITPQTGGRRIAVLGQMLELGASSAEFHAALAPLLSEQQIEQVFVAGAWMEHLYAALPETMRGGFALTAEELASSLFTALQAGDVVLVKGSHGSHVYQLVEALKYRAEQDKE